MSWTARQRAMLGEMGLRVWLPPSAPTAMPASVAATASGPASEPAARSASGPAAEPAAEPVPETSAPTAVVPVPVPVPAAQAAPAPPPPSRPSTVPPIPTAPSPDATAGSARLFGDDALPPATPSRPSAPAAAPPDDRARLIATLDWAPLRASVAGCTACRLCETRTHTVFGNGHPQAQWLVVGEAPGEQEDRTGEPFVGPAGQLLDRMLAALQLTRAADGDGVPTSHRVFVANTLKCRPPRNRNPMPDELALCEPYLQRQIALLRPRMILAMGAYALKLLLRSDAPVGKLRGQMHRYQGVPLVATYHPAYLLRQPAEKAKSWADLCLAAEHFVPREGDED